MSGRPLISAYTPSNTDPEILKRIFVQREKLLERIVDRLSRSMTTGDKHHILLVGPRGSGKTHLVSLADWYLQQREDLRDVMRVAWLGEDDSFTGLIHLAFGIASQLAQEYPDEFSADFKAPVRGLPPDDAALAVLNSIIERLQGRSLLLITENMDQTFHGLGKSGQKKWRAFLQETRQIATLATAQQLFAGVSDRKEAFFGFFDIHHLQPLSVEQAAELISLISLEQGKPELADYLNSAEGRFRIRALHYLAGGNHRMYVLLAEFLTKDSLDDLVTAFENLAHDMTPYFQERMRTLPDQQRQLAQCLCDAEGALTVKQVAEETFIDERSCSKQLGNLKAKGYVRSEKRGKESYYDMAEPLMRLCLEVKNQRGRPLEMVARFLRAWFPATALQAAGDEEMPSRVNEYRLHAMQCGNVFETVIAEKITGEINEHIATGRYDSANSLVEELHFADRVAALEYGAKIAYMQHDYDAAIAKLTVIIDMRDLPWRRRYHLLVQRAAAFAVRAVVHGVRRDFDRSLLDWTKVIDMPRLLPREKAEAVFMRGLTFGQQGEMQKSIADYAVVMAMPEVAPERKAQTLVARALALWRNEEFEASVADLQSALALDCVTAEQRSAIRFTIVCPMIDHINRGKVIRALERAFEEGNPELTGYGGTPRDLLRMVLRRSPLEWPQYVSEIAPLYIEHGVAEKLGQGVTQSIQHLDEGGFSESQIDTWNAAWQEAGKDCDDLQIPLRCLDAAVEVMKSRPPSDRPLFQLPLEIRRLVRPLLNKTLGEEESK